MSRTIRFILMGEDLLRRNANPSDQAIRDHFAGNLCRCAAYPEIIEAVKSAAKARGAKGNPQP